MMLISDEVVGRKSKKSAKPEFRAVLAQVESFQTR